MLGRRFALLVVAVLALAVGALPTAQAQDGTRTFPETGKTMGGRLLQYWNSHGGLAQQGFPISQQIQERSATDGTIYTVQYTERAVFEQHPENQPPYDVLLGLLGVFRYQQKYPQGAPGQTPSAEANARLFPETGKRLGGLFRSYWESHGGLAQQGFPISDEFDEVSDLDGRTYRVQYFERAVFEYHPENQPPYNVLLSQLGTFRYRERYGGLSAQLSGAANERTAPFALKRGLAVFQSLRAIQGGYFYIDVLDPAGNQRATIATGSIPLDLSYALGIPEDGSYTLNVQTEGGWTVNVSQPSASYAPPPPAQRWSGKYSQATPLFSLHAGQVALHATSNGASPTRVTLLDQNGQWVGEVENPPGQAEGSATIQVPADGVYLIQVLADADWSVDTQQ